MVLEMIHLEVQVVLPVAIMEVVVEDGETGAVIGT